MPSIDRKHTTPRMSKLVSFGDLVFLCGQTAGGAKIADVAGQTSECLRRVDALLDEAGSDKTRVLSALIHIKSMDDFVAMNAVWDAWVAPESAPARTTVQAHLASPDLLVEITIVAAR